MKKHALLLTSHLLLGGLVFFLAKTYPGKERTNNTTQSKESQSLSARSSQEASNISQRTRQTRPATGERQVSHSPAAFRAAWAALPDQKFTIKDRIQAQRKILAEWAKVDLAGAMEAAISEGWDDSAPGLSLGDTYRQGPFASALAEAFLENPEQSWDLLQSDEFGLGRSMLRHAWMSAMADKPLILASKLGEISWRERGEVIQNLRYTAMEDVTKEQLFQELSKFPDEVITTTDLLTFMPPLSLSREEAGKALAGMTDFESRGGKLALLSYGQILNNSLAGSGDDFQASFEQVSAQIKELPHAAQGILLHGLYTDFDPSSIRSDSQKTLAVLDQLIQGEHWELIDQREVVRQFQFSTAALPPAERAAWVTELPERKETYEIFYRGVEGYIGSNMDLAWDWIQEFPADHWRDRALAVYSQEALNRHKDYAASQRALDAINNRSVRNAAEGWRPAWAKEMDAK